MSDRRNLTADDRFMTDYSIYADSLDVDALLTRETPIGSYTVWRRGETTEFGPARSSGLRIDVFPGGPPTALHDAVREFLDREDAFLKVAQTFVLGNVASILNTSILVLQNHLPVTIDLPVSLLARLAERQIEWSITGFPCAKDGGIAADAPSNDEMQRTRHG
jgi:hypothetical protein